MMKVLEEIGYRTPQRELSEQDESRQALLFYRTYPALRVGIQIWAPCWQGQAFHASRSQRVSEFAAEFPIAIVQKIPTALQLIGLFHSRVPRDLLHPARVRVPGDAAQ
jgi:hypothetical protein